MYADNGRQLDEDIAGLTQRCIDLGRDVQNAAALATALGERLDRQADEIAALKARKSLPLWEDWGCRPNDRTFDNAPKLSAMLSEGGGFAATNGDYFCSTPILWPHAGGAFMQGLGGSVPRDTKGVTRLVALDTAQPGIVYSGSGCRMENIVMQGPGSGIAIRVLNEKGPPTGHLETRNLTLNSWEQGFATALEPATAWATEFTHYSLRTQAVKFPYNVNGEQSCHHVFFAAEFRAGYQSIFRFRNGDNKPGCGGPLYVYGIYVGQCNGGTLLDLGLTDSGTGTYEIHGLHTDGTTENLRLLEHGQRAHRVRITGNVHSAGSLAADFVKNRDGREQRLDIAIDCQGAHYSRKFPEAP